MVDALRANPTYSASHRKLYEELEGLSERGHILNVPGGACLRSEAMSKTASIYSAFLQQVNLAGNRSTFAACL